MSFFPVFYSKVSNALFSNFWDVFGRQLNNIYLLLIFELGYSFFNRLITKLDILEFRPQIVYVRWLEKNVGNEGKSQTQIID
jgi:hypothetical protein